jgi:hypothetical protein
MLEEPTADGFQQMLEGTLAVNDYLTPIFALVLTVITI